MPRSRLPISSRRKKSWGEVKDDELLAGWAAVVNRIIRGEALNRPTVVVGPTPELLRRFGLPAASLRMTVAKLARCRRDHPEVQLDVWHRLPKLLEAPLAIFPSRRRDGSMVVLLVVSDRNGDPILVAASPGDGSANVILSVYGKNAGLLWIANEIASAKAENLPTYEKTDFAASLPQPPVAKATSSSHGRIPSDGTAKPFSTIIEKPKKSTLTLKNRTTARTPF
jgi:Phage MuF-C-terminal domain